MVSNVKLIQVDSLNVNKRKDPRGLRLGECYANVGLFRTTFSLEITTQSKREWQLSQLWNDSATRAA